MMFEIMVQSTAAQNNNITNLQTEVQQLLTLIQATPESKDQWFQYKNRILAKALQIQAVVNNSITPSNQNNPKNETTEGFYEMSKYSYYNSNAGNNNNDCPTRSTPTPTQSKIYYQLNSDVTGLRLPENFVAYSNQTVDSSCLFVSIFKVKNRLDDISHLSKQLAFLKTIGNAVLVIFWLDTVPFETEQIEVAQRLNTAASYTFPHILHASYKIGQSKGKVIANYQTNTLIPKIYDIQNKLSNELYTVGRNTKQQKKDSSKNKKSLLGIFK